MPVENVVSQVLESECAENGSMSPEWTQVIQKRGIGLGD